MANEEIRKFTQRLPANLHEFARNEAHRRKLSLNEYITSLVNTDYALKYQKDILNKVDSGLIENDLETSDFSYIEEKFGSKEKLFSNLNDNNIRDFYETIAKLLEKKMEEVAEKRLEAIIQEQLKQRENK